MMKVRNDMLNTGRKENAERGQSRMAARAGKNGKRSWMGFYTHVALPILSLQGETRQGQC